MKTIIYKLGDNETNTDIITRAGNIIKQGGLVAFPTETVYGLGGDAINEASANRIYTAKGRPADNPLIIHICRINDIESIAKEIPDIFYTLAATFWPGPLTMILKKSPNVPLSTTGGLDTVAVRMPNHQTALSLIDASGGFVAAPSANTSGRPSPTVGKYVIEDMDGRVDMILDGGETVLGLESTILDLTGKQPEILRPGVITEAMLTPVIKGKIINTPLVINVPDKPPRAPGMKYRHYAPRGQMTIISGNEKAVVSYINNRLKADEENNLIAGVIASTQMFHEYQTEHKKCIGDRLNEEDIAHNLYRILREFDDENTDVIYSEAFADTGLGQAIMNRLLKAASYRIIEVNEASQKGNKII